MALSGIVVNSKSPLARSMVEKILYGIQRVVPQPQYCNRISVHHPVYRARDTYSGIPTVPRYLPYLPIPYLLYDYTSPSLPTSVKHCANQSVKKLSTIEIDACG